MQSLGVALQGTTTHRQTVQPRQVAMQLVVQLHRRCIAAGRLQGKTCARKRQGQLPILRAANQTGGAVNCEWSHVICCSCLKMGRWCLQRMCPPVTGRSTKLNPMSRHESKVCTGVSPPSSMLHTRMPCKTGHAAAVRTSPPMPLRLHATSPRRAAHKNARQGL